jgi:hypothetical protein
MKSHCIVPGAVAAMLTCLTLSLATDCSAQSTTMNSPSQRDMQSREWALTHIPEEVNKHFRRDSVSLFAQIREDFTRIQAINNQMMQTVFVDKVLDIKLIDDTSSEINKRALRLREYLTLPRAANDDRLKAANEEGIKAKLVALDRSIMRFVGNPVFKEPGVLDTKAASLAGLDLDQIIHLSNELKSCRQ